MNSDLKSINSLLIGSVNVLPSIASNLKNNYLICEYDAKSLGVFSLISSLLVLDASSVTYPIMQADRLFWDGIVFRFL